MKRIKLFLALASVMVIVTSKVVLAGPPLTNLEGVGGVALNPAAYLADSEESLFKADSVEVGKPRFGVWYVNLSDVNVDWTSIGVANSFFKRLELSYGYQTINQENTVAKHKHNIGAKLLLLPENSFETAFLPALSAGTIFKHTSNVGPGIEATGQDYYVVATKLITQLPRPVLISGGILSTKGKVTGVFGYNGERDITGFGNVDVILPNNFIVGVEYKQGAHYSAWKDADYWNAHLAWTPDKNLTLVLAYVNAGIVLSAQYAF